MSFLQRSSQSRFLFSEFDGSRSGSPGAASSSRARPRDSELEHEHEHDHEIDHDVDGERHPLLSARARQARRLGLTIDVDRDSDLRLHLHERDDGGRRPSSSHSHAAGAAIFANHEGFDDASGPEADRDLDVEGITVDAPLLPIFSSHQLDSIQVYQLTHSIRLLISSRCDTTLSWEQLRSPQVSQFLLKPMQQEIRSEYLSKATLYALLANALQFGKEAAERMAVAGNSKTCAMVCELLAIKLMKEYKTGELVEALSYDFDPLMGKDTHEPSQFSTVKGLMQYATAGSARVSCLEVAIRAQAKHFLAHPLVVRQLEAIWAGNIVFHSIADNLHRLPSFNGIQRGWRGFTSSGEHGAQKTRLLPKPADVFLPVHNRRSVTLYNTHDASLFKLSRLRVPRYRATLSTMSFAMLLILYLAVLRRQAIEITPLELTFWFWSAGYMLDEVVGFNEQGFSLYIMSFWNVFDLGILTLLFSYSCLRTVSALVGDAGQKAALAAQAYDVLAASAVLLLPRLFSVLDHVRYFSQLLIAFRMMAADLLAISILIVICCSGFFVAFTFAFNELDETPGEVVYDLFQMLMGFTPTAWAIWDRNSFAGRLILVCFMFISHFLVVTILVTVLTNSFMAVVQNADEEHQFLFAVNTISMVKSDALFAYIAPTNVLAWIVAPLRYLMPFREFLKLNRLIIKTTHFPVLFSIYIYERFFLARSTIGYVADDFYDDDDDHQTIGRAASRAHASRNRTFGRLVREPSVATFRKDQALAEVFRHPLKGDDSRSVRSPMLHGLGVDLHHRGSRSNAVKVDSWMETLPEENSSGVREFNDHEQTVTVRAKARRKAAKHPDWSAGGLRVPSRSYGTLRHRGDASLSVASDPEDRLSSHVLTFGAVRGRTTLAVPARASRLPIQRPARRSRLPPDVDDDAQHEGDNEEEDQPHEGMSDDEDEDDEGDGTDEEDEDEDEVQGAAHDSDGSSTEDEGAGGGTGYLKAGDGGKQDDDNTGPRTATASRHALHQHATSAAALRRPLATSHRRAHHSSEDEQGTEDLATRRLVRAGVAKRGSRSATTPPTSRHSTRPPTPRRTSRAAGLRPAKRELRQMTHASAPHGSHEGSVSNADETAGESADSEAAVMMRTPPRNSGTADPELIDFARRQASRPSAQRQGRERLGPLAAMRTTPDTPPVHQRPRSGSVTSATGAWADDGQSTTVLPSRRPGLSRAESHPVRSSALTPVAGMPLAIDIASDLGDNKAIGGGLVGAIPSSFATQMAYATGGLRREPSIERNTSTQDLLSRLVLARMKTLEEGFQQVVREVKDLKLRDEREDRRERERDREREWERRTTQRSPATANPQIRTVPKLSGVRLSSTGPSQRRRPAAGVSKVKDKFRALPQAGSARSNNRRSGSSTAHASTGVDTATSSDARAPVLLALEQEQEGGPEPQVNGGGGIKPGPAYDLGTSALGRGEADQEHRFTVEPQAQPQD